MDEIQNEKSVVTLKTQAGYMRFSPAIGNVQQVCFSSSPRWISPLHAAHWLDDLEVQANSKLSAIERVLAGDFFCAPFGKSDIEDAPPHGWSANSVWDVLSSTKNRVHCRLQKQIMGASIEKNICLADDAPLLYQVHRIENGAGGLTVAHHPMIHLESTGQMSMSPKRLAITPDLPLESGKNSLICPAQTSDLKKFPAFAGGTIDLCDLPISTGHEDFVSLIEAEESRLGWTAVVRAAEDDIIFFLKDPRILPITMLWYSNGGRDYPPWKGQHTGVLGIEDGCAAGAHGHRAALADNPISTAGVATALPLSKGSSHRIAHVMGAIACPAGWHRIETIYVDNDRLTLIEESGEKRTLSFDSNFFRNTQ